MLCAAAMLLCAAYLLPVLRVLKARIWILEVYIIMSFYSQGLNCSLLCAAAMLLCAANLLEHASLGLYGRQIRESVYRVLAEGKVTDYPIYTFKGLKVTLS